MPASDFIRVAEIHAGAAPGANTDILASDWTAPGPGWLRIGATFTTATVLNLMVSDGTTEYAHGLNNNNQLAAGVPYTFCYPVMDGKVYQLQIETDSVVEQLVCDYLVRGDLGVGSAQGVPGSGSGNGYPAIYESGLTEAIGTDEQVDVNEYSASFEIVLNGTSPGRVLAAKVFLTEDGSGAIHSDFEGRLLLFDADPSVSNGATTISAAARVTLVGVIEFLNADLLSDANGGSIAGTFDPIPFHSLGSLWGTFQSLGATSINSAGGDDEQVEINLWYEQ